MPTPNMLPALSVPQAIKTRLTSIAPEANFVIRKQEDYGKFSTVTIQYNRDLVPAGITEIDLLDTAMAVLRELRFPHVSVKLMSWAHPPVPAVNVNHLLTQLASTGVSASDLHQLMQVLSASPLLSTADRNLFRAVLTPLQGKVHE